MSIEVPEAVADLGFAHRARRRSCAPPRRPRRPRRSARRAGARRSAARRPSRSCSRRRIGMTTACTSTIASAARPIQKLWIMMKRSAVPACVARKTGWMKASPMKPPIGSTSSLIMLAASAGLTVATSSGRKRRSSANRSKRMPAQHALAQDALGDVDQYLKAPLIEDEDQEPAGSARTDSGICSS